MADFDKKRFYILIGEAINIARNDIGYSQAYLAEKISMSRASIVNIEKGRQHPPIHLLWQLSKILKVSIIDLLPQGVDSDIAVGEFFEEQIQNKADKGLINANSIENLNSYLNSSEE